MLVNYILNLFLVSIIKTPVKMGGYVFLKFLSLLFLFLFFGLVFSLVSGAGFFELYIDLENYDDLYLLLFFLFSTIFSSYQSRSLALDIQDFFIRYMLEVKLKNKKNKSLLWIRPITVEVWNYLDAILTILGIVIFGFFVFDVLFLFLVVFSFLISFGFISFVYVNYWINYSENSKSKSATLFLRLKHQNIMGSISSLVLYFLCIIVAFMYLNGVLEVDDAPFLLISVKFLSGIIPQILGSIPRVARYFSKLPNWPVFWSKKLWL